jgi:hypothetical protein
MKKERHCVKFIVHVTTYRKTKIQGLKKEKKKKQKEKNKREETINLDELFFSSIFFLL